MSKASNFPANVVVTSRADGSASVHQIDTGPYPLSANVLHVPKVFAEDGEFGSLVYTTNVHPNQSNGLTTIDYTLYAIVDLDIEEGEENVVLMRPYAKFRTVTTSDGDVTMDNLNRISMDPEDRLGVENGKLPDVVYFDANELWFVNPTKHTIQRINDISTAVEVTWWKKTFPRKWRNDNGEWDVQMVNGQVQQISALNAIRDIIADSVAITFSQNLGGVLSRTKSGHEMMLRSDRSSPILISGAGFLNPLTVGAQDIFHAGDHTLTEDGQPSLEIALAPYVIGTPLAQGSALEKYGPTAKDDARMFRRWLLTDGENQTPWELIDSQSSLFTHPSKAYVEQVSDEGTRRYYVNPYVMQPYNVDVMEMTDESPYYVAATFNVRNIKKLTLKRIHSVDKTINSTKDVPPLKASLTSLIYAKILASIDIKITVPLDPDYVDSGLGTRPINLNITFSRFMADRKRSGPVMALRRMKGKQTVAMILPLASYPSGVSEGALTLSGNLAELPRLASDDFSSLIPNVPVQHAVTFGLPTVRVPEGVDTPTNVNTLLRVVEVARVYAGLDGDERKKKVHAAIILGIILRSMMAGVDDTTTKNDISDVSDALIKDASDVVSNGYAEHTVVASQIAGVFEEKPNLTNMEVSPNFIDVIADLSNAADAAFILVNISQESHRRAMYTSMRLYAEMIRRNVDQSALETVVFEALYSDTAKLHGREMAILLGMKPQSLGIDGDVENIMIDAEDTTETFFNGLYDSDRDTDNRKSFALTKDVINKMKERVDMFIDRDDDPRSTSSIKMNSGSEQTALATVAADWVKRAQEIGAESTDSEIQSVIEDFSVLEDHDDPLSQSTLKPDDAAAFINANVEFRKKYVHEVELLLSTLRYDPSLHTFLFLDAVERTKFDEVEDFVNIVRDAFLGSSEFHTGLTRLEAFIGKDGVSGKRDVLRDMLKYTAFDDDVKSVVANEQDLKDLLQKLKDIQVGKLATTSFVAKFNDLFDRSDLILESMRKQSLSKVNGSTNMEEFAKIASELPRQIEKGEDADQGDALMLRNILTSMNDDAEVEYAKTVDVAKTFEELRLEIVALQASVEPNELAEHNFLGKFNAVADHVSDGNLAEFSEDIGDLTRAGYETLGQIIAANNDLVDKLDDVHSVTEVPTVVPVSDAGETDETTESESSPTDPNAIDSSTDDTPSSQPFFASFDDISAWKTKRTELLNAAKRARNQEQDRVAEFMEGRSPIGSPAWVSSLSDVTDGLDGDVIAQMTKEEVEDTIVRLANVLGVPASDGVFPTKAYKLRTVGANNAVRELEAVQALMRHQEPVVGLDRDELATALKVSSLTNSAVDKENRVLWSSFKRIVGAINNVGNNATVMSQKKLKESDEHITEEIDRFGGAWNGAVMLAQLHMDNLLQRRAVLEDQATTAVSDLNQIAEKTEASRQTAIEERARWNQVQANGSLQEISEAAQLYADVLTKLIANYEELRGAYESVGAGAAVDDAKLLFNNPALGFEDAKSDLSVTAVQIAAFQESTLGGVVDTGTVVESEEIPTIEGSDEGELAMEDANFSDEEEGPTSVIISSVGGPPGVSPTDPVAAGFCLIVPPYLNIQDTPVLSTGVATPIKLIVRDRADDEVVVISLNAYVTLSTTGYTSAIAWSRAFGDGAVFGDGDKVIDASVVLLDGEIPEDGSIEIVAPGTPVGSFDVDYELHGGRGGTKCSGTYAQIETTGTGAGRRVQTLIFAN